MRGPGPEPARRSVTSFDGTRLAARHMDGGDGLPLLVANGIGANLAIWRASLVDVVRTRPVVTWDQRGMYDSDPPASDRIDSGAQAEDAVAVLDDLGYERVALASWSTGSRIALEVTHRYPERVAGVVLVCGAYGYSVRRMLRNLEPASGMPLVAGVAKHFASLLEGPVRALVARPEIAGIVRQSGFIAASADTAALVDFFRGMASCDLRVLLATFEAVAGDPTPELLPEIGCPALVIAGERDAFTPVAQAAETAALIPGARLSVYDHATHYLPIEYPARLSDELRTFLDGLRP